MVLLATTVDISLVGVTKKTTAVSSGNFDACNSYGSRDDSCNIM